MNHYFLRGKLVGLRVPNLKKDIIEGEWANWFNDDSITKYLVHGVYPNSIDSQLSYVEKKLKSQSSILLVIDDLSSKKMIGVISLDGINHVNRSAEIAIVMGGQGYKPGAALEAMGLLTMHGFEKLNLNKIQAGQHVGLWKWVNTLELIGFKLEGYIRDTHLRYGVAADSVRVGITHERYRSILKERRGQYFGEDVITLMKSRRKENMCAKLDKLINEMYL